jgi:hypothetical protein
MSTAFYVHADEALMRLRGASCACADQPHVKIWFRRSPFKVHCCDAKRHIDDSSIHVHALGAMNC